MDGDQMQISQGNPYLEALREQIPFQTLVHEGLKHAAVGLSGLLARSISLQSMRLTMVPLEEAAGGLGDPETLVVGILLASRSDAASRFLLVLPLETACQLVDLAMEQPGGTTQELDDLGYSVMGELGNLVVAYFLNRIAQMTHTTVMPSPPAVTVDMLGAVLDAVLLPAGLLHDRILLSSAVFHGTDAEIALSFLLVPDLPDDVLPHLEQMIDG